MFNKKFLSDEVFNNIRSNYVSNIIYWIIDSKYRTSIRLSTWMKELSTTESIKVLDSIPNSTNYDEQAIYCLHYVRNNITYKSDTTVWKMSEKWQTPDETLIKKTGDCEDGAILLYQLCRLKGIPSSRLLLLCGDVVGGGHCWLAYKPMDLPINFVFLDWCYWYDANSIDYRTKFYMDGKQIIGFEKHNYLNIWLGFNEDASYYDIKY
jgi:transglutaminase-like putative cysteine protease